MAMSFISNPIMVEDYVETSKQITKALKCVAFTNMQVGDMMLRKHERLEKRIFSISEEIELLRADVVENVINQRERRQQLTDIEEDIERAEVLGNSLMVEELLDELRVLQEEGKREEALYRSIKKALRSRKKVRREFILEKKVVEEEMRTFNRKQNLIQSLLTTFAKDSLLGNSQSSSASQSDYGSNHSEIDESQFVVGPEEECASELTFVKSRSLGMESARAPVTRRWSADDTHPTTPPKQRTRARRSLSVTFSPSPPTSLGSVDEEEEEEEGNLDDLESGHQEAEAELLLSSVEAEAAAILLEEIHDEQDNYYSHSSSDSSDDDTGSEVEEEDHEAQQIRGVKEQAQFVAEETRTVLLTDDESSTTTSTAVTRKGEMQTSTRTTSLLTKTSDVTSIELHQDQTEVETEHSTTEEAACTQLALAA